jgi:hypothetical protein
VRTESVVTKSAAKASSGPKGGTNSTTTITPAKKASPLTTSRAGRKNSPRIDYRTGQRLEIESDQAEKSTGGLLSPGRRPLRTLEASGQSGSSVRKRPVGDRKSNSPILKKKSMTELFEAGRESSGTRRSGRSQARLPEAAATHSEDEEVVLSTPPPRTGRYVGGTAAANRSCGVICMLHTVPH